MITSSTIELLKEMRFGGMASELERQLTDAGAFRDMPFEDRLAMLVEAEWNHRQVNKYTRNVHNAHFAIPSATVKGIEYHEDRKLSKQQILQLSTCNTLRPSTTLSLREPADIVRLILPVRSAKLPVVSCSLCGISACRSCSRS